VLPKQEEGQIGLVPREVNKQSSAAHVKADKISGANIIQTVSATTPQGLEFWEDAFHLPPVLFQSKLGALQLNPSLSVEAANRWSFFK